MGNKKHFIYLRGLARESTHWGEFAEQMKSQYPQAEHLFLDLAGNGDQKSKSSFLNIADNTQDLIARTPESILRSKPVIIGISMGAMVAADWAWRYPQYAGSLVLINTSFKVFSKPWQRLRPQSYQRLFQIFTASLTQPPSDVELQVLRLTSNQKLSIKKHWSHQVFSQVPTTSGLNFTRQIIAAAKFRGHAFKPEVPVLLLSSLHDRMVDQNCSEQISHFWQCPHWTHPWAGHDLTFDDPAWVVAKVSEAL